MRKTLLAVCVVMISIVALADMEHKTGQGSAPTAKELSLSRSCFTEIEVLGCKHPGEDQKNFPVCLEQKLEHLSAPCKGFFTRLYLK
ncbi:MAG TPA: hypothetical protein VNJ01_17670 [Bacteriovoracaceae bacterium]|nr:hypothetical protein [Bacteriovoracaceae bacterium]